MSKKKFAKKTVLSLVACVFIIIGITMVLAFWPDVIRIFRGGLGIILAFSGLAILYSIRNE